MIQVVPGSERWYDWYALERLETLVLNQAPASVPWTPVSDYSFEARLEVEGPHAALIKETFRPVLAVDAGCGPDGHLVKMLQGVGVKAMGFDPQIPRRSINPALVCGSLNEQRFGNSDEEPFADLVICREVLEHLTVVQIAQAVGNLCHMSARYVYVTTRFATNPRHLLEVETSDDLDPTHISLLNQDFLRTLFVLQGFRRRGDLEMALDWKRLGRVLVYERS